MSKSLFVVGMLLPPGGKFRKLGTVSLWSGEAHLAGLQPRVPLRRGHDPSLRPVGEVIHVESAPDGVWVVAEVLDAGFSGLDERRYLSAAFTGAEHCVSAQGSHLRFENVVLTEVSLVATPGARNVTEVGLTASDPRLVRGGHSWGLSETHRRAMERAHDHLRRPGHARSELLIVANPITLYSPRSKATGPTPHLDQVRAMLAGRVAAPAAGHHREVAAGLAGTAHRRRNIGRVVSVG